MGRGPDRDRRWQGAGRSGMGAAAALVG